MNRFNLFASIKQPITLFRYGGGVLLLIAFILLLTLQLNQRNLTLERDAARVSQAMATLASKTEREIRVELERTSLPEQNLSVMLSSLSQQPFIVSLELTNREGLLFASNRGNPYQDYQVTKDDSDHAAEAVQVNDQDWWRHYFLMSTERSPKYWPDHSDSGKIVLTLFFEQRGQPYLFLVAINLEALLDDIGVTGQLREAIEPIDKANHALSVDRDWVLSQPKNTPLLPYLFLVGAIGLFLLPLQPLPPNRPPKDKFDNFLPHLGDELSILIFETDTQGIVTWREGHLSNSKLMLDLQPGESVKTTLAEHPRYLTYWQHTISGEKLTYEIEQNSHCFRIHQFPLLDEHKRYQGTSVLVSDITSFRDLETQMRHQQLHDQLTGLPNRQLFMEQLLHTIQRAKRHQEYVSVLALEISGIGEINRRYGHKVSDQLLQKLAEGIRHSIRSEDTLCRFSNDEFLFALNDYSQSHLLQKTAEHLIEIATTEYDIENNLLSLSANVGIATFPRDARDAGSLVSNAITAMRHARQTGRNRLDYFSEDSAQLIQKKWQLEKDLSSAINAHGFELHYQPIFDLKTNQCIAAEALLRWPSANIPPDQFIPLAEENGLIHKIGFFVIESAIAQFKQWINQGCDLRYMSVNLSVLQLERDSFFSELEEIVSRYPFDPGQIVLEITESVMMQTDPATVRKLERLKSMGFELAIDDFGTGFSSLNYLKHLPVKLLKVDRSFVSGVIDDPNDAVICEAIIQMSVAMDLKLIAEGVETPEQMTWLAERGVSFAQGYFYAKAVPARDFSPYLRPQAN